MNFKQMLEMNEVTNLLLSDGYVTLLNAQDFEKRKLSLRQELDMLPDSVLEAHAINFDDAWLIKISGGDNLFFRKIKYNDFFKLTLEKFIEINNEYQIFSDDVKKFEDFFVSDDLEEVAFGLCQLNLLVLSQALENNETLQDLFGIKKDTSGNWSKV